MPDAGITTDIIVGFPGESDEEFIETLEFVKNIRFSRIHVFKYSPRKGTPAAKYKDQVHGTIKSQRSESLIKLAEQMMREFNYRFLGKKMEVLFEKIDGDYYEGYTSNYIRVKVDSDKDLVGQVVKVDIHANEGDYLIAKVGR